MAIQKNKFLVMLIVALLLINTGTLGYLFYTSRQLPPPPPQDLRAPGQGQRPPPISQRLKDPLNLSDAQAVAIDSVHFGHIKRMDSLDIIFHEAMTDYFQLLTKTNYTSMERDALLERMSSINAAKADDAFSNFEHIGDVLNAKQKELYLKLLPEILQRTTSRVEGRPNRQGPPPFPPPQR